MRSPGKKMESPSSRRIFTGKKKWNRRALAGIYFRKKFNRHINFRGIQIIKKLFQRKIPR